jgi:hypothetical protein
MMSGSPLTAVDLPTRWWQCGEQLELPVTGAGVGTTVKRSIPSQRRRMFSERLAIGEVMIRPFSSQAQCRALPDV